jgi:mannitol/fructose-specific phosphotransferase system IIA component (Ntr-type)
VLTLVPPSVSTDYTRLMGAVMRALDREGRAALLTAKTAHEVLDILACGEK